MGIPVASLLDSTVMVTIRQSDSEAIASEAATASISRGDATAIAGLVKPAAPEDRVMVQIPETQTGQSPATTDGRITRALSFVTIFVGKIGAGLTRKRQNQGNNAVMPVIPAIRPRFFSP